MAAKLTAKQQQFIAEYLIDLNATAAAVRAGYAKGSAEVEGHRLLRNANIAKEIASKRLERSQRTQITADYVLMNIQEVAERCMQKVPVMYYDKEDKCMKQETALIEQPDGTMKEEGVWKFDSAGANKSLELLGKHLKLFTDKTEVTGKDGNDITINVNITDD